MKSSVDHPRIEIRAVRISDADLAVALTALDLDPDDPADAVDVAIVTALVEHREAERRLREVDHPAITDAVPTEVIVVQNGSGTAEN